MRKLGLLMLVLCVGLFLTGCPQTPTKPNKKDVDVKAKKVVDDEKAVKEAK